MLHGIDAPSLASLSFGGAVIMSIRRPHRLEIRQQIVAALLLAVGYDLGTEFDGVSAN
ncbi:MULTISPECIES: hypothetical protein [Aminobacter]|jgi:hypothetical protein|uniref:hypothetical protein n=1 Tax=Aminobacter TaxID=31988 RepID=UPI002573E81D|nr:MULTISPECIES: hypothetical protein [Aminobacter]WMD00565.1 hypothetical protein RAR13_29745 [Aminobacter niigataensis]